MFLLLMVWLPLAVACSSGTEAQPAPDLRAAQAQARESGKKLLIDVYAVWCGYCRQMDNEVYPDPVVAGVIDRYFVRVRLNAESDKVVWFNGEQYTEAELAASFGVRSFPTTVFVASDGSPIGMQPGFMDVPQFSRMLRYVGSDAYKSVPYERYTEDG